MKPTKLVNLSQKPLAFAIMSASVIAASPLAQATTEQTLPVRTLQSIQMQDIAGVQIEETKSIIDDSGKVAKQSQVTAEPQVTNNTWQTTEPTPKPFSETKAQQEAAKTASTEAAKAAKAKALAEQKLAEEQAKAAMEEASKATETAVTTETTPVETTTKPTQPSTKPATSDTDITEGQAVNVKNNDTSNNDVIENIQQKNGKTYTTTNLSNYAKQINSATWTKGMRKNTAMTVKLQALLDWNHASPGPIDGGWGMNSIKALTNFQAMSGLPKTGKLDAATWSALTKNIDSTQPVLMSYTITKADTNYKFTRLPSGYEAKSKMSALNYGSIYEKIAEEYHMDINYLKKLNKGKNFVAGQTITVYNPGKPLNKKITRVVANKADETLYAYNGNKLVATYPTTVGSAATPSPHGTFKIANRVKKPHYKATVGEGADKKVFMLKPGPNSPVGIVWMGLTKPTYGLHGSPRPEGISRQQSHGCIRLTNWDVLEVYANINTGATVVLE